MIRIIVRSDYASMAVNVGGAVESEYRTFDFDMPALEAYLTRKLPDLSQRQVLGVEVTDKPTAREASAMRPADRGTEA